MESHESEIWLAPESPLILIAQPDSALRSQMSAELVNYRLREVCDGREALAAAREEPPDAIILAAALPGHSGAQVCLALRTDPVLCWVPVAITMPRDSGDFEEAIKAGAAEVITTPLSSSELELRLRNMVRGNLYLRELERKNSVIMAALNDLKHSEAMLVQAEKMSFLGEMSAGIVHEINNPLNYAKSALFVLQRMVKEMEEGEDREEYEELVGDLSEGLERVGRIIRDLRSFAMKGTLQVSTVDLRDVVRSASRLMGNRLGNITFVEDVPEGLFLRGNENTLCQVLLNLIKNGVEATEEAGRSQSEAEIRVTGEETASGLILRVRDNGSGLSKQQRTKMFEPFFTTKDRGSGMGLGLSICRRIIEDHGGKIRVESEEGAYTEFILSFPAGYQGRAVDGIEEGESQVREAVLDYEI